jgi:hypothetical protein
MTPTKIKLLISLIGLIAALIFVFAFTPNVDEAVMTEDQNTTETPINKTYENAQRRIELNDNNDDYLLSDEDVVDSINYINNQIQDPFLKNIFYTVLDTNVWLFNHANNPDLISEHANKVMLSTFCLAGNVTPRQREHLYNMMNLLVGYDPDLLSQYQAVVINMQDRHDIEVPDKNKLNELCSIFNQYPADGFQFSIRSQNNETQP